MAGIMASDFRVRRGTTRHRKLRTLVARFGGAAGWAVFELWDYAVDHAPDGNLGPLTDEQLGALTSGAMLPCGAAAFGAALIEVGLVDRSADGITWVHDWLEEQGHIARLLEKREAAGLGGKESARVRRERDGSAQPKHPPKHPPKHARSTPEAPTEAGPEAEPEAEPEARPSFARAPVPDRTGPDLPGPDRGVPPRAPAPAMPPIPVPRTATPGTLPPSTSTGKTSREGDPIQLSALLAPVAPPPSPQAATGEPQPPREPFGTGLGHRRAPSPATTPRGQAMELWLAAFERVTGRKGSRNDSAMLDLSRIVEDPDQGLEEIKARLPNFEAAHRLHEQGHKVFGAEAFTLAAFCRHFERWAVDPKPPPPRPGSREETSADVARRLSKLCLDTLAPQQAPALPPGDGTNHGDT